MNFLQLIFLSLAGALVSIVILKTYLKHLVIYCTSKLRLDGKVAIVTGATSGIGYETAKNLAKRGAKVYIPCRNVEIGEIIAEKIRIEARTKNVKVKKLDLSLQKSVREFCMEFLKEESRLDILINNAGVALAKKEITSEGYETHYATNHLGPFLLTNLLLGLLVKTAEKDTSSTTPNIPRIVNVSSVAHKFAKINFENLNSEKQYENSRIYAYTKLYNVLFNYQLDLLLKESNINITTNVLHPGAVQTEIYRHAKTKLFWKILLGIASSFFSTPWEGAQTSIHLAVSEEVEGISGLYWDNCKVVPPSSQGTDKEIANKLWNISLEQTSIKNHEYYFKK